VPAQSKGGYLKTLDADGSGGWTALLFSVRPFLKMMKKLQDELILQSVYDKIIKSEQHEK